MKKLLTIAVSLLLTLTASADRKWNFTNWSASTIANLKSDVTENGGAHFANAESSSKVNVGEKCYWGQYTIDNTVGPTTKVGGTETPIPEFAGLTFSGTWSAAKYAIALDYQDNMANTDFGPYYGPSYFWINGKTLSITIPSVKPGAKITMGLESHKKSDARGVKLTAGSTALKDQNEATSSTPTVYADYEWMVPSADDLTAAGETLNDDGTIDVKITTTNGCHIYYLNVFDSGSDVSVAKKVGYIYNSSTWDESSDMIWSNLGQVSTIDWTRVDVATASSVTLDSLYAFDAIVVSPSIAANDAYVPTLKSAVGYEPMINLNPAFYAQWGYGSVNAASASEITISDADNELFTDENVASVIDEGVISWNEGGTITGVTLGDYFANDNILAKAGDVVAIHQHNPSRNSYMFLPLSPEEQASMTESALTVLTAAIDRVANSKKTVTAAATPSIKEEYGNNVTTVSISCSTTGSKVYYTLDGSTPTAASTLYTESFTLTSAQTVKAIAYADGYNESAIAELTATIKQQAATPTISVVDNGATATVTISCATDGATVYYNYTGSEAAAESAQYAEAFTVSEPVTITAFAAADGYVNSEIASATVQPSSASVRYDILTKFDANRTDYSNPYDSTGTAKSTYLFSWGKKAQSMYDTNNVIGTETLKDINGNDSIVTKYAEVAAETLAGNNGEWIVESQGQTITWENTSPKFNVGDDSNYNPAVATDVITANDTIGITSYFLNFGGKVSGEPYNARLRTAKAYAGPFDIVAYIGQGNGSNVPQVEIQTSKDGVTWDSLSMANIPATKRLWSRTKVSYEGSDAVYVRFAHVGGGTKAMIYNAYLLNAGTHTQEWLAGINDVNVSADKNATVSHIYNLNGVRQSTMRRGINIVRYSDGTVRKVMK